MPRYDYVCECGVAEERTHSMLDESEQICTECESVMSKTYTAVAVSFVGPHFYSNSEHFVRTR